LLSFNVCFVCAVNNVGKHEMKKVQMREGMHRNNEYKR
jgi:hypothetical protein